MEALGETVHRIYLIPGMFGFGRLAGYDYFGHVERALSRRFEDAGIRHVLEIVPTPPTASIRRRALVVAERIGSTAGPRDRLFLVGHSTGGLDARLLSSPSASLAPSAPPAAWIRQIRRVVTINAPHHGTPLAGFFATVSGTRLLYALSLLTFTTLKVGGPPLTVFSGLVAALGSVDEALGVDVKLLDGATDLVLRFLGDRGRDEVRTWLDGIRRDQGGIIQITPEAADLFNAAVEDSEDVEYGSIVTAAPAPGPMRFAAGIRSPYAALSATIFTTLYQISSREYRDYPCPAPDPAVARRVELGLGRSVSGSDCDGVVPTLSMLWGRVLWAGAGDHLDIVGHFRGGRGSEHVDWLTSGAGFSRSDFGAVMDALATFLLP